MKLITVITIMLFNILSHADEKVITLGADPWCPWNCSGQDQGIAIDVAKAIFEPLGYKVQYVETPWTRAIKDCVSGTLTGIIGADHVTPEIQNFAFPDTPLNHSNSVFTVKASSNFTYTGLSSLKDKVIGLVADYHFSGEIGKYIDDHYRDPKVISQIAGNSAIEQNLKKLLLGRTDMYIDDAYVIKYTAMQDKISDQIKLLPFIGDDSASYIAFSPALPYATQLAQLFDEGMKKIKADGTYQKILAKYNINDVGK